MRKCLLLVLIFLYNVCFCGNIVSENIILKKVNSDSLYINVKDDFVIKNQKKSNFSGFSFSGFSYESISSMFNKDNSLFFATGDILNEDFEKASGWTYTNGAKGNKWVIGTAVKNGGTKSLYISKDDGVTYEYDTKAATVVHAYKDFTVPATAEEISVSFDWKCLGDGTNPKQHYFNAWLVPDTYVPVMGTKITALKDQRILIGSFNNNGTTFKNDLFVLDSKLTKGKKQRIVFEWINNITGGWQPPAAIDNLKISTVDCPTPSNIIFEDIKTDNVLMKWDSPKVNPDSYDIYYSKDNIPPTNTTVPTKKDIKTTSSVLDKLDSNTIYYVWIRSVCGTKTGFWSKVYQFKTACGVFNIPFNEGFNTDSKTIDCWTITDGNNDKDIWKTYKPSIGVYEGDQAMNFNKFDYSNTIENNDWLISPTLKMNGTYRLKYHYRASSYSGTNEFEVLLSKDGKETKDFKQTLVAKKTYNNGDYIEKTVILNKVVGDINIAWHANGKGSSDIYIDNVIIEKVKNCPEPMELDVEDIKIDQATIFWQDDFGGKKWEYFVQEEGEGEPIGSGTSTNKKKVAVTKDNSGGTLKPNTAYEYYVRVDCGGGKHSIWSGPKTFKTKCDAFTIPFSEGFNTDSKTIDCWTIIDGNKDDDIWKNGYGAFEGDRAMYFNKYDSSNTIENDDWLISPTLKMNGTYRLKYHYKASSYSGTNEFEVLLSKDGKEIKDFKKTLVSKKIYKNGDYIEKTVILYNVTGDINIAWHANGKGASTIYLDNVIIEEIKDCAEPMELDVKDVLADKATILWVDDSGEKSWEYFVQTPGKGEPTKDGTPTSKKENVISTENEKNSALLPNTDYEFYVRTKCGSGKNSVWSGPFVFRTSCGAYNLPFWEGFNTLSKTIDCWTIVDENKDSDIWKTYSYGAFEGDQLMYFSKSSSDSTSVNDDWLISPTLKMNGTYRLKYNYKTSSYSGTNDFEVLLSKNGKSTKDFKQTLVAKKAYNTSQYIEKKVILNKVVGDINIAWHANGKGASTIYIDNVIIEEVENCPEPMDLDVKDILPDKATIFWTDDFGGKSWEYYVQLEGKGEPTKSGTITSKKENEISIDNGTGKTLLPNTEYEYYVRTACGDGKNSIWSGPFVFRTACGVYDLPFWEGFNKDSESIYCWSVIDANNDKTTWGIISAFSAYEGNQALSFSKFSSDSTFVNNDWLISPTVKTTGGMYRIKYHYKTDSYSDNNEFEILMSKKGIDEKDFTDEVLKKQVYKKVKDYTEKVIFIDNLNGDVNFAWHVTATGSSNVYLDNVFIEKVKGCPEPYYVEITEQTDNSVSIEWEQYGSGDKWEVIAVPYGEEIPDEKDLKPTVVTKKPKATITGLESGKVYTFYVRVICKDGKPSDWSTGKSGATKVKANNDCLGAYNIPVNGDSDCNLFTSGTFLGATLSKTSKKTCSTYDSPKADVWFEFTAKSKEHVINISDITSESGKISSFSIALYSDDCSASGDPIECFTIGSSGTSKSQKISKLEIGKKYYLRAYSDKESDVFFKLCISTAGLYVSPSGEDYTVEQLVKEILVDSNCDLVSNIKYQAGDKSKINTFGYFNRRKTDFPYEKGIVLSTHAVYESPGPYTGEHLGKLPEWVGDPDLNEVIDKIGGSGFGSKKYVSVLEFDFIPIKDSIKFEYIFASESYLSGCTVVCKPGGALFAAWLKEISTGEGQNLAMVPGTTEPIAISTIRDTKKTGAACGSINPKFFGQYYPNDVELAGKAPINYAGVTVPMTSEKVAVKVGEKYHIKIAIADFCPNKAHTSAVFFNGGSFDLGNLDLGTDMLVSTNTALCEGGEKTIYSGLDKEQATIRWYKDGVLIPGENDSKLTVSELGDYEVVGKYEFLKCEVKGSIRIEIFPKLEDLIGDAKDINYCANSLTDKNVVDITANEQIILNKKLDAKDCKFFYYLTKEDSENDKNAIDKPTAFEIPKDGSTKEIYVRVFYKVTGCSGFKKFNLVPQKIVAPVSPGDQQVCASYTFKELPQGQHYYSEAKAQGKKYKAGDVIDKAGDYKIYVCSIAGDCYEEVSFNLEILPAVKAKVFKDETLKCENYVLQDLPADNRYFTEPDEQGEELSVGDVIRFNKTIYVYAKSAQGPNYCIDQSSFTITFEDCDIPKGISPNGDGFNDVLDLEVHGVTSIVIYNRYGGEVYSHGEGYTNQWHGQDHSGDQLPDGTYYYAIEARGKTKTGWIQINR